MITDPFVSTETLYQDEYSKKSEQTLVQLFRFLQAKDIFIQQYLLYLSDRLLYSQSNGGAEKEQQFADLFKQECGDNFAS